MKTKFLKTTAFYSAVVPTVLAIILPGIIATVKYAFGRILGKKRTEEAK